MMNFWWSKKEKATKSNLGVTTTVLYEKHLGWRISDWLFWFTQSPRRILLAFCLYLVCGFSLQLVYNFFCGSIGLVSQPEHVTSSWSQLSEPSKLTSKDLLREVLSRKMNNDSIQLRAPFNAEKLWQYFSENPLAENLQTLDTTLELISDRQQKEFSINMLRVMSQVANLPDWNEGEYLRVVKELGWEAGAGRTRFSCEYHYSDVINLAETLRKEKDLVDTYEQLGKWISSNEAYYRTLTMSHMEEGQTEHSSLAKVLMTRTDCLNLRQGEISSFQSWTKGKKEITTEALLCHRWATLDKYKNLLKVMDELPHSSKPTKELQSAKLSIFNWPLNWGDELARDLRETSLQLDISNLEVNHLGQVKLQDLYELLGSLEVSILNLIETLGKTPIELRYSTGSIMAEAEETRTRVGLILNDLKQVVDASVNVDVTQDTVVNNPTYDAPKSFQIDKKLLLWRIIDNKASDVEVYTDTDATQDGWVSLQNELSEIQAQTSRIDKDLLNLSEEFKRQFERARRNQDGWLELRERVNQKIEELISQAKAAKQVSKFKPTVKDNPLWVDFVKEGSTAFNLRSNKVDQ